MKKEKKMTLRQKTIFPLQKAIILNTEGMDQNGEKHSESGQDKYRRHLMKA